MQNEHLLRIFSGGYIMKNIPLFILMSIIAILMLSACTLSPSQPRIAAPTAQPTPAAQLTPTTQLVPPLASVPGQSPTDLTPNQSSSQQLFVSISSVSTQGSTSIKVHTLPGAQIKIELSYCDQHTNETKYADSAGDYTLNWTPQGSCGGTATARVTASSNGQSATSVTSFSVS